jgi:lysophospholipase L1-like esterase
MGSKIVMSISGLFACAVALAEPAYNTGNNPYLAKFHPLPAPENDRQVLKKDDRLAICGDSITEQKMYSRIMETYLTVCQPELNISVRQYGWSGEQAPGFLGRMTNDCLRFNPTVATTCYGMNDHHYRAYEPSIGKVYGSNTLAIIKAFKSHGTRVVIGSAGCVGKRPTWVGDPNASKDDLNLNLCELRNIDVEIAKKEKLPFADVFWPMLTAEYYAIQSYGTNYAVPGKDGVHPGWAGHVVMAYAFLHAFDLDGNLGTFTVDLKSNMAKTSKGHEVVSCRDGEVTITSHRYPFCTGEGDITKDDNVLAGTKLVPFNEELNHMMLVVKHANAGSYLVTWGNETKSFSGDQLSKGINLAAEFVRNPFVENFRKVDEAVAAKQAFETKQIKQTFRSADAKKDMEAVVSQTEKERAPLVAAIKDAFVPVTHTIKIVAQ